MLSRLFTRRRLAMHLTILPTSFGVADWVLAENVGSHDTAPTDGAEISHHSAAIHQELMFESSRERVYHALTDSKQFDQITQLSGVMQTNPTLGHLPTHIDAVAGGAFSLFDGYISGRQVELMPHERIVQAWRTAGWIAGAYSIATFVLLNSGSGTKLVFDHQGFPPGEAKPLAMGWHQHYWQPLKMLLDQPS